MGIDQWTLLYTIIGYIVFVMAVATWVLWAGIRRLTVLRLVTKRLEATTKPARQKNYKVIERPAGSGGEGAPPMSTEELNRFSTSGWRLHTALYFGNGDLHYILEKEGSDD